MSDDDVVPAAWAFAEAFDEDLTDAVRMGSYARTHWHRELGDAETDEEIGRLLVSKYSCGPRHWTGVRILRSLGLLIDTDGTAQ
ncbi:MAG: hypothetical protein KF723_03635 [Rhizobiaceae bacterium]|nr:hypothetical protein [Rhizobiaceae bacterium]